MATEIANLAAVSESSSIAVSQVPEVDMIPDKNSSNFDRFVLLLPV